MTDLLLPGSVVREIQKRQWAEQRARRRATLMRLLDFEDPVCREWTPELRKLDPFLSLGRARDLAYELGFTVRPGFYHWVRDNPTADLSVTTIEDVNGNWVEPDSGLLDALKRNDLQDPKVFRAVIEQRAEQEKAAEAQREAELDRANSEVLEIWNAKNRAQISMSRATPWTQNARGRKGG